MIFFMNSKFILSSCLNICFVVMVSDEFWLSVFCDSARSGSYSLHYLIFQFLYVPILHDLDVHVFLEYQNQDQSFFKII